MKKVTEEKIKSLTDKIVSLPEKQRDAMAWFIEYRDYVVALCKVEPLTPEQREEYMERALENDDAMMTLLLVVEKRVNVDGMEFEHTKSAAPKDCAGCESK